HFYLAFPVIYFLLTRWVQNGVRLAALLWGICACVLAWRLALVFHWNVPLERTLLATDTRIDGILFGCALAVWGNPILDGPGRFSERAWKWLLFPGRCTGWSSDPWRGCARASSVPTAFGRHSPTSRRPRRAWRPPPSYLALEAVGLDSADVMQPSNGERLEQATRLMIGFAER